MLGLFPKKRNAAILAAAGILAGCASSEVNYTVLEIYRKDNCEKLNKSDEMFRRAIASASSDQATLVSNWKVLAAAVNQARLEKHCSESGGVIASSSSPMPAAVQQKLGIQLAPVPASLTVALGLTSTSGALTVDIVKGLPADKAGIEKMDIVLGINGKKLATPGEIISAIGQSGGNPRAEVQIWRNRSLKNYVVDLSSLSSNAAPPAADQTMEAAARDFDSGHYFDALKKYQRVVRQDPNDALAWYFIGQTLEKMHEPAGAQAAYKRSLEIQPQGQVAESARQTLANLSSSVRPSATTRREEEKWTKAARRTEAEK